MTATISRPRSEEVAVSASGLQPVTHNPLGRRSGKRVFGRGVEVQGQSHNPRPVARDWHRNRTYSPPGRQAVEEGGCRQYPNS
jgi:hypothetical protein